jgi:vitamin B12 transporter
MRHKHKSFSSKCLRRAPLALLALTGAGPLQAQESNALALTTFDDVVVTSSREKGKLREVSSNVTIIDEEDIRASTATSVADLMTQHGFHVVTTGDTSNVQIRGIGNLSMTSEHENSLLILLNGRRIGLNNLALAGLANVARVEIVRGPAAVQYGSSALGGVVNIITRRGEDAKPFVSLEVGVGSDSLKREKLAFGGSANGFDFSFGGTNSSHGDVTVSDNRRWHHTKIDKNQSANLDLGYTFNKNHRVGLNYNHGEIKSEFPSSSNGGIRPYSINTPDIVYTDYVKDNKNTALSYTGSVDSKNLDWGVNYSWGSNDGRNIDPTTGASTYKTGVDNEVFNAQLNYHADLFSLSGGVDQFKYDTSTWSDWSPATTTKTTIKDTGFYLSGKLRLLEEKLIFSLGLRHDKYKNSGNNLESSSNASHTGESVGVSYLPTNWLKLRANYAEGFKMPSPTQTGGGAPNYSPNHSLKPEVSKTWEVGADINWNHLGASLTYFHSDWKDKIIGGSITPPSPYPYQYQNLASAKIAGVEGALSWNIGQALKQNYSLTPYVNVTYLGTRKNNYRPQHISYHGKASSVLPYTPEWMVAYGLDYAHPGLKLKTRLNANYYGKQITRDWSDPLAGPPLYNAPYISRPTGTVVNWSLEKELTEFGGQYGKLTLRTEINNVFDAKNEMYWGYPGSGRSFYVGLRYAL